MTIAQKLIDVNQAKQDIKTAIEAKGVSMAGVTFPDYHTKIAQIQAGGGGTWTPDDVKTWERPTYWPTATAPGVNEITIIHRVDQQDFGHTSSNLFNLAVEVDYETTFWVDFGDGDYPQQFTAGVDGLAHITYNYDWNQTIVAPDPETGYKAVQVRIYGLSGSNIIKILPFYDLTNALGYYTQEYRSRFLEMHINAPSLEELGLYDPSFNQALHAHLEYVNIIQWGPAPSIQQMFNQTCRNLKRVDLPVSTHGGTAVNPKNQPYRMFYSCYNLMEINGFNMTGLDGSLESMFYRCSSLQFIPFDIDFTNFSYSFNFFREMNSLLEIQSGINIDISNHGNYQTDWNAYYEAENDFFNGLRPDYPDPSDPEFQVFVAQSPNDMFTQCYALQIINPTITVSDETTEFYSMFYQCHSLLSVPSVLAVGSNTNIGDNNTYPSFARAFYECFALKEIPADWIDKPVINLRDINSAFQGCKSLQEINWSWSLRPNYNANHYRTFYQCHSLYKIPDVDTSGVGSWQETFYQCYNIVDFGPSWSLESTAYNYPTFNKTFYQCYSMVKMPGNGDLGNATTHGSNASYGVTNAENCFQSCESLVNFGTLYPRTQYYNQPNCQNMFSGCDSLREIGDIDLTHLTGANNSQNYGNLGIDYIGSLTYANVKYSAMNNYTSYYAIMLRNNNLSATQINQIFTDLQARTTGTKQIYVGNNPGSSTCNTSIASSKGWLVYV